ncbi:MAG: cytochrome c oxidase subunit II [Burkholderiales bacterium]
MKPLPLLAWLACDAVLATPTQNALSPAGPQATHIHGLWHVMLWTSIAVFAAVFIAFAAGVLRGMRRGAGRLLPPTVDTDAIDRPLPKWVGGAVALSIAGLAGVFAASLATDRALAQLPLTDAVTIEVTGHQWWWEVRYDDPQASNVFTTANEIRIPVGRPVLLTLQAGDVIHSLWVPNLAGKKDLIPGRTNTLALRADQPGAYRAQCAEFCGWQHAMMALWVIAVPSDDYERWLLQQREAAPPPATPLAQRGRDVFAATTCPMCHAVAGTQAAARMAPDLSHVASRRTLGAGALENTPAHLAAWVRDAPAIKPGNNMPPQPLPADDMNALLAYLATLR